MCLTILLASVGSICLFTSISYWQTLITPAGKIPSEVEMLEHEEQVSILEAQIEQKNGEIQSLIESHRQYEQEIQHAMETLNEEKEQIRSQMSHKEDLFDTTEQTVADLRATIEKKQLRIAELEGKVRDLSYEIKTLLKLAEGGEEIAPLEVESPPPPVEPAYSVEPHSDDEAFSQLERCLNTAQKMTGGNHYSSSNPRLRGIPIDNYVLDLRCLFDTFRSETSSSILFYSPTEEKLLFASDHTKTLTGWSPDKFVQNFSHIVQNGEFIIKNATKQLSSQSQVKIRLMVKARTGEDRLIHGLLGMIPTGIFRNHVIIVLFSSEHQHAISSNH